MNKRIFCILLLLLWVCGAAGTAEQDGIISEMVAHYDEPETVSALLDDLTECDAAAGERWRRVMDYWRYVNEAMRVRYDTLPDDLKYDGRLCIAVMGFQLMPDGSMRQELIDRLRTALNCAGQYPDSYILVTGGGTALLNPEATEADAMAEWLTAQGIEADRIIIENRSRTTDENAAFSHAILRERYPDVGAVAIVTGDYHVPWASMLFQAEFILNGDDRLNVIAHAASRTEHDEDYLEYQAAQLLRLAGVAGQ